MKAVRTVLTLTATAAVLWGVPACGDNPFDITWTAAPDTVLLYSLDRPELNLPSAFDFLPTRRREVVVEAPGASGNWDLALDTRDGALVFVPPRGLGIESDAGVASFPGLDLEGLEEAPSDSAEYALESVVPVETGTAYAVRTRRSQGQFGRSCRYFAEVEALEVNPDVGTVRFVYDVNPSCNDRSLVPDETTSP